MTSKMTETCMWLVLLCVAVCCTSQAARPPYIGCQDTLECGKDECCVIGMGRFSIPVCKPRQDVGEDCRPRAEPVNTTLHYPDDSVVHLTQVYHIICPCLDGLGCVEGDTPQCRDSSPTNHVLEYSEEFMYD